MAVDPVSLVPVVSAVIRLAVRGRADLSEPANLADLVKDAEDAYTSTRTRQPGRARGGRAGRAGSGTPGTEVDQLARELLPRLREILRARLANEVDQTRAADLQEAVVAAGELLLEAVGTPDGLRAATDTPTDPAPLRRHIRTRQQHRAATRLAEHAQPFLDELLDVATAQTHRLLNAPANTTWTALRALMADTQALQDAIDQTHATTRRVETHLQDMHPTLNTVAGGVEELLSRPTGAPTPGQTVQWPVRVGRRVEPAVGYLERAEAYHQITTAWNPTTTTTRNPTTAAAGAWAGGSGTVVITQAPTTSSATGEIGGSGSQGSGTGLVTGDGGVGKTQLAAGLWEQAERAGVDLLVWVDASDQTALITGYAAAAAAVHATPPPGTGAVPTGPSGAAGAGPAGAGGPGGPGGVVDPVVAAEAFLAWLEVSDGLCKNSVQD